MKKKKFYAIPAKIIVIAALSAASFLAGLAGMRLLQGHWIGMTMPDMAQMSDYENSSEAANYLYREGSTILSTLQNENNFCSYGSAYDETGTIDIMNLSAGVDNPDKNPETTYTLAELASFYGTEGYYELRALVDFCDDFTIYGCDPSAGCIYTVDITSDGNTSLSMVGFEEDDTPEEETEADVTDEAYDETEVFVDYTDDYDVLESEGMGSDATEVGTISVEIYSVSDELYETITSDWEVSVYGNSDNVLYNNGIKIEEEYGLMTAAGFTLADYVVSEADPVSLWDCYFQLLSAAEQLNSYLSGTEETNALLYVCNISTDTVYTNVDEWKNRSIDQVEALYLADTEATDTGTYCYCKETENAQETTVSLMGDADSLETYGQLLLSELRSADSGYYEIFLGLDTNYPLRTSSSYTTMREFEEWNQSNLFYPFNTVLVFIVMLGLTALMLVFAVRQTGRAAEDEEIHPAGMDRFPLELMMLGDLLLWFFLIYWPLNAASFVHTDLIYSTAAYLTDSVFSGAAAAALCVLLLAWELKRYGRRVKEKSVGGSLIGTIVRWVRKTVENARKAAREGHQAGALIRPVIACYLGFAAVQFIFLFFALRSWYLTYRMPLTMILLLILLAFDVFVLLRLVRRAIEREQIRTGMEEIARGNLDYQVDAEDFTEENRGTAETLNHVREGVKQAVETEMKSERLKTDLITNVSHDIKTPLTSIINYVDILKRENFEDERIAGYIEILDRKSQRMKQLTEDLVEAAKISSGVINLDMQRIDLKQLLLQAIGEMEEKFDARNLTIITDLTEGDMHIRADGRRMYRVIENLLNNAAKYSMPGSRVYISGENWHRKVVFTIKNMSEYPLNLSAEEMTERFVRGDVSRTTEGSGLGLEIAKNLTTMQGGELWIYLDGDLFKVTVSFSEESDSVAILR
ncbi:MAG: HAMP domain-containing histidine kinase [Clostridiales bacterium]|nr:HAMP domain-containing histidine kinase [Clostridiales bacterium]